MKQFIYLSTFCIIALSACTGAFKKGDNGLEYKIISSGSGKTVAYGSFMQMHIKQVYGGTKDTVLMDTRDYMARINVLDSVNTPLSYFKILKQMRKGDSLIIRLLTDSAVKGNPQGMPPFMKKGKYLYTSVKMINIFQTEQEADSANKAETVLAKPRIYQKQLEEIEKELVKNKAQIDKESKVIEEYLLKNNIKAQRTKWGTYVAVVTPGTGEKINNTLIASVNYTGKSLDSGKVFDSNIDPKFSHVQPLEVNMAEWGGLILGLRDGLLQLNNGAKATLYIPSSLGYGTQGNGEAIKPDMTLVFDIDVISATTEAEIAAKQKAAQEKMMEVERARVDSIEKATKK